MRLRNDYWRKLARCMAGNRRRVMAVAVRMGRLAAVLVVDGKVLAWEMSRAAVIQEAKFAPMLRSWIVKFRPEILVSENPDQAGSKGERSLNCLRVAAHVFEDRAELNMVLCREQTYENRYEEAAALAERYPEISGELPLKPPCWDKEHPKLVLFDALSLADQVIANG